jgi:coniferyl-aldehyde dehydrogenase
MHEWLVAITNGTVLVIDTTHAGGVTVNDWGWHVVNHDAPLVA